MSTSRKPSREVLDLAPREREILRALIHAHVLTGEPVGSRTVADSGRDVGSSATVRAAMGVLEERGLLAQPHTSAGRVPTDAAYRMFVDHLMGPVRIPAASAQQIDEALRSVGGEFEDLLAQASRMLSRFSSGVGLVVAPEIRKIVVERVEFARLGGRRVMAIVVGRSGVVHHRMLEVDSSIDQEELDRVSRYLNDEFRGMTLPRMREELLRRMTEERARLDLLVSRSLELGRQAVEVQDEDTEMFVEGTANLVDHPEFADVGRMRTLLFALDEKTRLVQLLGRVLDSGGVQVLIGSEAPDASLDGLSLVASRYRAGERALGSIGIVGPTRMSYVRAIALVDYLARRLTELLADPDSEIPQP